MRWSAVNNLFITVIIQRFMIHLLTAQSDVFFTATEKVAWAARGDTSKRASTTQETT